MLVLTRHSVQPVLLDFLFNLGAILFFSFQDVQRHKLIGACNLLDLNKFAAWHFNCLGLLFFRVLDEIVDVRLGRWFTLGLFFGGLFLYSLI
jgi:hypothetical protein